MIIGWYLVLSTARSLMITTLTKHLTSSSLLARLDALPKSMFPLPSTLGHFLLSSPLLGPMIQIVGDLVIGLEDCNGVVPSRFEAWEEGAVSDFIVVLRPVFVVLLWFSALSHRYGIVAEAVIMDCRHRRRR